IKPSLTDRRLHPILAQRAGGWAKLGADRLRGDTPHPGLELMARRPFLAPEVIQTSEMDCGPAALKCLLEGFGVRTSYNRLREACQTDIDGSSIDTIEDVANLLGVPVVQQLVAHDGLFDVIDEIAPALLVTRMPTGFPHFVILWRRVGNRV